MLGVSGLIWIKRNYKVVLLTVLFSTLASLFFPLNVHPGFVENDSIATAVSAFFFIESNDDLSLSITISAMMFVPLIPLLGVFKRDYGTELWYCITRYRSRKSWFFKKTGSVLFLSFVSTAVYFVTISAVMVSRGVLSLGFFGKSVSLFLWFFALRFFFTAFFALLLNVVSIAVKLRYIVAIGVILVLGSGMASVAELKLGFSNSINPYVHATYYFHAQTVEFDTNGFTRYIFENITLEKSAVYFVLCIALILLAGMILNDRLDIGILEEE